MSKRFLRTGWFALAGLLFGGSTVTGVMLSKEAEHRMFSVVSDLRVTRSQPHGDGLLIWGEFTKNRDCRFVEANASAGAVQLDLEFWDENKNKAATRAKGLQMFGPWRISPALTPVTITARHECHFLWLTTTVLIKDFKP